MNITTFNNMKHANRQDIAILFIHLLIWILLIVLPAIITYLVSPTDNMHHIILSRSVFMVGPMFIVYMITYYFLAPRLLFKGRIWWFVLASLILIIMLNSQLFFADMSELPVFVRTAFYSWLATSNSMHILVIMAAIGIRSFVRSHKIKIELESKLRQSAEAELVWLKNQLNPHFLFNSLNNISSLTQIDPEKAQDAIGQLSDLLRYALYESNKPQVPLGGEIDFMSNYIALMQLRCSDKTVVETSFNVESISRNIVPLLFISFIENAFKHGTSNNLPSHVSVSLTEKTGHVIFECRNTNLPKGDNNHSGSGIGLENTRRRLELCYPDNYTWEQKISDNDFCIRISINIVA